LARSTNLPPSAARSVAPVGLGITKTRSSRIGLRRAEQRLLVRWEERASFRRVLGTLIHHATLFAVLAVSVAVVEPSLGAALVSSARLSRATSSCRAATALVAVPIAVVAPAAKEEDLAASSASDEP
jgi:hypothetical protein